MLGALSSIPPPATSAEMLIFRVGVKGRTDERAVAVPGGERADHEHGDKRVPSGVYGRDEGLRGGTDRNGVPKKYVAV